MTNAKERMDVVLWAHVSASAATSENYVIIRDVEDFMKKEGVAFTTGKDATPMTDRAKKVCIGLARRQYEKVLRDRGMGTQTIAKEIRALNLKKIKDAPVMSKSEDYAGFDTFQELLRKAAKGQ